MTVYKANQKTDNVTGGARVLFLYPNERGMSTVPAAIAILSRILKDAGHITDLFDTTFYEFVDEIAIRDFDEIFRQLQALSDRISTTHLLVVLIV